MMRLSASQVPALTSTSLVIRPTLSLSPISYCVLIRIWLRKQRQRKSSILRGCLRFFLIRSSRYLGVTPPISTSVSTEREKEVTITLMDELRRQNMFETEDESQLRWVLQPSSFRLQAPVHPLCLVNALCVTRFGNLQTAVRDREILPAACSQRQITGFWLRASTVSPPTTFSMHRLADTYFM